MKTFYEDNLRLFDAEPDWRSAFETTLGDLIIRAETAFGAVYCRNADGRMFLLNPEDRNLTDTECTEKELLSLIEEDPDYYIDHKLYQACCSAYGKPRLDQHFAYRHPLALGGRQEVANVLVVDAGEHMRFLGNISAQIAGSPAGTLFHPIGS